MRPKAKAQRWISRNLVDKTPRASRWFPGNATPVARIELDSSVAEKRAAVWTSGASLCNPRTTAVEVHGSLIKSGTDFRLLFFTFAHNPLFLLCSFLEGWSGQRKALVARHEGRPSPPVVRARRFPIMPGCAIAPLKDHVSAASLLDCSSVFSPFVIRRWTKILVAKFRPAVSNPGKSPISPGGSTCRRSNSQ